MDVKYIKSLLNCFAEVMQENREFLIEQDSIVLRRLYAKAMKQMQASYYIWQEKRCLLPYPPQWVP